LRLKEFKTTSEKNHTRLEVGARKLTEDHHDYQPSAQTIISIVKNILPELKKNDITLGIENHDRFKGRELVAIMDAIADEHVGICLDSVNSIGAGEGLELVADLLAPYTVNLHIKDFHIQRLQHKMGFSVTGAPAGTGMLNVPWLIAKLLPFGRCQSAILEQWATPEATTELTIKKEMSWADQGINYLKSLPYFKTN
jgi:sugar phosphate isomerase/epimerase